MKNLNYKNLHKVEIVVIVPHVRSDFLKQNSDGVQNGINKMSELALSRTYSDPKYTYGRQNSRDKQEIAKAWLKFKEDIEAAMQKKPNSGYYKNLADMMTTKMESLNTTADQVGTIFLTFCIHTGKKTFITIIPICHGYN